jgi:predicted KAP-like P-loop ATPase
MQNNHYLNDKAEDTEDRFNRKPFAHRIAETIANRSDSESLVIGMYGVWGEGKTTVLNYIRADLEENHAENALVVPFNPWRYGTEQELLRSFFETLADALGQSLDSHLQKAGKFLKEYGESFEFLGSPETVALVEEILKKIPIVSFFINIATSTSKILVKHSESNIENQKKKIDQILRDAKKRIVIFIDDIDRLDKTEIQALFRLIKLTADFPYTCYVLSFDDEMVAAVLGEQYAGATNVAAGRNFLEKIIQVPLHIPKAPQFLLNEYFFKLLDNILNDNQVILNRKDQNELIHAFNEGVAVRIKTPRACKRFINALTFATSPLRQEINIPNLILFEAMRIFYPELYEIVRKNPEYVITTTSKYNSFIEDTFETKINPSLDKALEKYSWTERDAARKLFTYLFPIYSTDYKTGELILEKHKQHSKWNEEKRIASAVYFDKYFEYSVSENDISDLAIDELVATLEEADSDDIQKLLEAQITTKNAAAYIIKLKTKKAFLTPEKSKNLAQALCKSAPLFPDNFQGRYLSAYTPFEQVINFVSELIANVSQPEQDHLLKYVIQYAQPDDFIIRLFINMKKSRPDDTIGFLTGPDENKYGQLVAARIKSHFYNIFKDDYPEMIRSSIWIWGKYKPSGITSYFDSLFADDPHFFKLLRCYFPQLHRTRERYDELTSAISTDIIVKHLKRIYGESLNINVTYDPYNPDALQNDENALQKVAASQFLEIYHTLHPKEKSE